MCVVGLSIYTSVFVGEAEGSYGYTFCCCGCIIVFYIGMII